jgi:CDP-2,3-bis-(O-geranylgeranyl)-sn-glycerol synthase
MAWWETVLRALWLFLPAYTANMAPVIVAKLIPGWNAPIDGGRLAKDGRRVLGAGKTWRGLAGGAVVGGIVALLIASLAPGQLEGGLFRGLDLGTHGYDGGPILHEDPPCPPPAMCAMRDVGRSSPTLAFTFGALVGAAALVGDAVKSYYKRRLGKEGGAPWVPFDQLDFVVFGLLAMVVGASLLPAGWVRHALLDDWLTLATLVLLTPILHLGVNALGYVLGLKKVPW